MFHQPVVRADVVTGSYSDSYRKLQREATACSFSVKLQREAAVCKELYDDTAVVVISGLFRFVCVGVDAACRFNI